MGLMHSLSILIRASESLCTEDRTKKIEILTALQRIELPFQTVHLIREALLFVLPPFLHTHLNHNITSHIPLHSIQLHMHTYTRITHLICTTIHIVHIHKPCCMCIRKHTPQHTQSTSQTALCIGQAHTHTTITTTLPTITPLPPLPPTFILNLSPPSLKFSNVYGLRFVGR